MGGFGNPHVTLPAHRNTLEDEGGERGTTRRNDFAETN